MLSYQWIRCCTLLIVLYSGILMKIKQNNSLLVTFSVGVDEYQNLFPLKIIIRRYLSIASVQTNLNWPPLKNKHTMHTIGVTP